MAVEEDFKWFMNNYNEFQNEYGDSFIVIKNKKVIGIYESYADGVRKTSETEEIGTFIVQQCSKNREAYLCSISSMDFN